MGAFLEVLDDIVSETSRFALSVENAFLKTSFKRRISYIIDNLVRVLKNIINKNYVQIPLGFFSSIKCFFCCCFFGGVGGGYPFPKVHVLKAYSAEPDVITLPEIKQISNLIWI